MISAQTFSYPELKNDTIYVAPLCLNYPVNYILKYNINNDQITKIKIDVDDSLEKWQHGITYKDKIYWLPYNESKILCLDTTNDEVSYINVPNPGKGRYVQGHIYNNELVSLPYGEHSPYDYALHLNLETHEVDQVFIDVPFNDEKKWHTTQIIDGKIIGLPRGENWAEYFNYMIEYDCKERNYKLTNMRGYWEEYDVQERNNKKFTTLAKVGNKLFAPPYSENPNFDIYMYYDGKRWTAQKTGLQETSRKYFTHKVTKNGKIFFPPAGHDENWAKMFIVDSKDGSWNVIDLGIGKESKKYFAGVENSKGKMYYIPRGGCVCEPEETWKSQGDLAEILVIDTYTERYYTIDVSEYFKDNTTIEKYNRCVIHNDIIYAFPYGESDSFQTVLIFDTIKEKVIKTLDLNEL